MLRPSRLPFIEASVFLLVEGCLLPSRGCLASAAAGKPGGSWVLEVAVTLFGVHLAASSLLRQP